MLRPQVVNRDAFIKNFSSLWKGKEDVSIKEMAHNWFWVPSVCDHDRRRVLDVEPYAYRRSLVLLVETPNNGPIHTMPLHYGIFWVRFDVDFPLISLTSITFPETGERLIEFKYKYLPEYCFACGKLGHSLVSLIIVSVEQGGVASVGCVLMVLLDRRRRPALRGLPSLNMRGLVTRLGSVVGLCVHLLMVYLVVFVCFGNKVLSVQLISSSIGHIDAWITFPTSQVTRVTRFYNYLDPVSSIDEKNGSRPVLNHKLRISNILKTPRLVEPLGGDTVFTLKSSGLRMRNVVW
ncbi:unnamed protein product [Prunus armeniaca]|uniref:Zinc knuckle CX2CX4HX4C domain-containing protein n=1 Tax=Prunus armeniaca TaxID=36596 RepID=A0A6J5TIR5_PRUAR|nr:unnamed protein product [Prunus armeniaca]